MSKMEELYTSVCEKLERETQEALKMAQVVDYLKERARNNADNCMALLDEKKTLTGAYEAIKQAAQERWEKNRKERCVCIDQKEACVIIDAYYGLKADIVIDSALDEKRAGKVVRLFDML